MSGLSENMATLQRELNWFLEELDERFDAYFTQREPVDLPMPDLSEERGNYARLLEQHRFGKAERILFMLAITPHLAPQNLDLFFTKNNALDRGFSEFGGYLGKYHGGFLPTCETAIFLLSLGDIHKRLQATDLFRPEHPLMAYEIIERADREDMEPSLSSPLSISQKYLKYVTTGEQHSPESFSVFPAKKIKTNLEWDDLVIDKFVREDIDQIKCWIDKEDYLLNELGLDKTIKPGYRSLFYGPPGTGKTLTACLLGKATGRDVYKVDLSVIVSKYIGETEKNLARIFDYAEKNDWILFFDEADALFGKRTQTKSSNDRFANQEVAYLLQRIEDFPGVIILASNLKSNMDEAFSRRFQSMVYFAMPGPKERLKIWTNIFSGALKPAMDLDLQDLAKDYELSGGSAINVYRFGALKAMSRDSHQIRKADIIQGIQKEFQKEGKTI